MVVWGRVFVGCFLFVFVCFVCFSFCFRLFVFVPPIKWSLIGVDSCTCTCTCSGSPGLCLIGGELVSWADLGFGEWGEWASCGEVASGRMW